MELAWDYSPESVARLEQPLELPEHIARGLDDTTQRADWNQAAPEEYAFPTETWRELTARRQRYAEVRDKLADGDVQSVNDLDHAQPGQRAVRPRRHRQQRRPGTGARLLERADQNLRA